MAGNICFSCSNSVYCPTWTEVKCLKRKVRFTEYGHFQPTKCPYFKERGKNFKEPKCQCKSCLENEKLLDEESEGR